MNVSDLSIRFNLNLYKSVIEPVLFMPPPVMDSANTLSANWKAFQKRVVKWSDSGEKLPIKPSIFVDITSAVLYSTEQPGIII